MLLRILQKWLMFFPHNQKIRLQEKIHVMVIFVASSLVSFFKLLFSKYMLKDLRIFVAG